MAEVEAYDQEKNNWTTLSPMPTAHCSCAYITIGGCLRVVGGLSPGGPTGCMEGLTYK